MKAIGKYPDNLHFEIFDEKSETSEQELSEKVNLVLSGLKLREKDILQLHYRDGYSLREISEMPEFQVSRERIRQIKSNALRKCQKFATKSDSGHDLTDWYISKVPDEFNIWNFNFKVRTFNALWRAGYRTAKDIKELLQNNTKDKIIKGITIRNFGKSSYDDLILRSCEKFEDYDPAMG